MKDYQNVEKLMSIKSRNENPNYATAYKSVVHVYSYLDFKWQKNYVQLLSYLYDSTHKRTFKRISVLAHMDENTLRKRRKEFAECFEYFLALHIQKRRRSVKIRKLLNLSLRIKKFLFILENFSKLCHILP